MTNLPKIRVNRGNIGNEIWVHLPDLSSVNRTSLSGDEAAAQTALSVLSSAGFAADDYILIGIPGTEQAEILKITSVATGTITSAAITYAHGQGAPIFLIPFNQIELSSAASAGGSYSIQQTIGIRADSLETYFQQASDDNTIYYKARFKNSNDTTYSDYSDEVVATGFTYDSVYSVKKRALDQLGEKIGGTITDEFLNESLWEARRELDKQFKRWSFRTAFDTDIGNMVEGGYSVSVPSTLRNPDSPQNILAMRIGNRGRNITYVDKGAFNNWYEGIPRTTVATQPSVGATSLVLTDTRDFASSGSVVIGSNTITYTTNTLSTGTLSGVPASGDGSIDDTHAVGLNTWQNASFGEPTVYTIYEDTIRFNVPFNSDFEGANVYMDFYRTLPEYDSDADTLDEPDVDMFVSYLKFAIKSKKEKGTVDLSKDPDYQNYAIRRNAVVKKEFIHQDVGFVPDIGHLIDVD